MKRIFHSVLIIAAVSAAFSSCRKENADSRTVNPEPFLVTVNNPFVEAQPQSRATFADGRGMSWEGTVPGDFRMVAGTATGTGTVQTAQSLSIDESTGVATFEFSSAPAEGSTVSFFYGPDSNLEYTFNPAQTQTTPGKLDAGNLCLKAVNAEVTETSAAPRMQLVGTFQRFLIYSSTGKYSGEKVESIQMTSSDNVTGLIGYNYLGQARSAAGAISGEIAEDGIEKIFYHQSKSVSVNISNQAAVSATNREETSGKGIYIAVPPVTAPSGYSYVITTDAATYTLTSTKERRFTNGEVSNIFVNLDNEAVIRRDRSAILPLRYEGSVGSSYTYSWDTKTAELGYLVAYADDTKRENNSTDGFDGTIFYSEENVKFACVDDATGKTAEWISCKYRANNTYWDVTMTENDGDERSATITCTYNVPGYEVPAPKVVKIVQEKYGALKQITFTSGLASGYTLKAEGVSEYTGLSWNAVVIGGTEYKNVEGNGAQFYPGAEGVTMTCIDSKTQEEAVWVECRIQPNDTWLQVLYGANKTGAARSAVITITYDIPGYVADPKVRTVTITQPAM